MTKMALPMQTCFHFSIRLSINENRKFDRLALPVLRLLTVLVNCKMRCAGNITET